MSERLVAAEAALKAGRNEEAVEHVIAAVAEDPARPLQVYRVLLTQLYGLGRYAEGETWSARAVERHPRDVDLWNIRGVLLRRLGRPKEALAALDEACRVDPRNDAPQMNRGNVLLDLGEGPQAEATFAKLARQQPRNAEVQRQLGRALLLQGKTDPALVRFRQATSIRKDFIDAWIDLAGALSNNLRTSQAEDVADKALAANPNHPRLLETKAIIMRRAGELRRAAAFLEALLPEFPDAAWLHYQIANSVSDYDRERANVHFRRAVELAPGNLDYLVALIESVERTRSGDEGANIEEAYQLARTALARNAEITAAGPKKALSDVLVRVAAYDELPMLGDFRSLGRAWAESGRHTALMKQLARVTSLEDRHELLEQHKIWAETAERYAADRPIRRPARRQPDGRIRLGLMSSDLRRHPVGYFALPLFEHVDERFDLYCYSYYQGGEDDVQKFMASRSKAYRWNPEISFRDAAQVIADDQLDMLIELGGSTHMNKLDVMAYRPAPRQASWLGYPHSAGLSTIDYLVVDPYVMPERPDMILEKPLMLPHAWYPLGSMHFRDQPAAAPEPPVARNGYVTFGTANNPGKYTAAVMRTWARVMQACPGSQFLFIRPEGGASSFREHVRAEFAKEGVAPERVQFEAVRGAHLPHYNRLDISLDTFPQTGGTTTCESLWMGAPCVTLVGDGVFERLSYSVLMNLDLPELCARTVDDYVAAAVRLASNPARIAELRSGLRERMKASPLGRTDEWARDFYAAVAQKVAGEPVRA